MLNLFKKKAPKKVDDYEEELDKLTKHLLESNQRGIEKLKHIQKESLEVKV